MRPVLRLVPIFALAVPIWAQHPTSAADAAHGKDLFVRSCSACHGDNAKGGRGPDLTTGVWKHGSTDEELTRNITRGIAGTQMPPVSMPDSDARAVIAFLRSLAPAGQDSAAATGDIVAGKSVFASQCASCHMFQGEGGILGSDLTTARARHKAATLLKALAQPITYTQAGAIKGINKSEDTFTIQLLDEQQRWHAIDKRAAAVKTSETPHPALSATQRDNVTAFVLRSPVDLRTGPAKWTPAADFNVTYARLRNPEPRNWLSYWGDLRGTHYSALSQIKPSNIETLKSAWTFQSGGNTIETTPLVVDGMMFVTGPLNNGAALDARTGQVRWRYTRRLPQVASNCTVMTNRGFGILGDRLYMATLDRISSRSMQKVAT